MAAGRDCSEVNTGMSDQDKQLNVNFNELGARDSGVSTNQRGGVDQRFGELEARLEADFNALKQRLLAKMANLDQTVTESIDALNQRITAEHHRRDHELKVLQDKIVQAEASLNDAIVKMEDQAHQDLAEVRLSLEESHNDLLEQTASTQAELTSRLERQKEELQTDKVGRQALATMLDEVALKLRGVE